MTLPSLTPEQEQELQRILDSGSRPKFNAPQLGSRLAAEIPVSKGGGQLYAYRSGCYRSNGRDYFQRRIASELGDDWKRFRSDETLGWLMATARELAETPPLDLINFRNGILDLRTGSLEKHTPEFLSPIQIPVDFDPAATCPMVDRFLDQTLDPDLHELIYEIAGYLLVPDNRLQVAFMFLGAGGNGKSTVLELLTALIGHGNVSATPLHKLDESRFATASLYGKLANIFSDLDSRALQSSSAFKAITGGDRLEAERKHGHPFTFKPFSRLLFSANEPPPTPDHTEAFFRRWLIVPFEKTFKGDKADRHLLAKLTTASELSGLVNRGLERLPALRERGAFTVSEAATKAAERFQVDTDSVAGYLAECTTLDPDGRVEKPKLYPAYRDW
ncbi:MAG: hypothetical protein KDB48_07910, partial [Solirubrobacterales bacterium]|nr:hypothetical protein [Solirubrobacterales bacterium]